MRTTPLHHTTSLCHESYPPPPSRATLTLDGSEDSKISLEGLGAIDLTDAGLAMAKIAAAKHAVATARPTLSKEQLHTQVVAAALSVAPVVPPVAPPVAPPVVAPFDVALFDDDLIDIDLMDGDIDLIDHSFADALGDREIDTTPLDYDTRGVDPLTV